MRNLEELTEYHRELLKDFEWHYGQVMEQLISSQRTIEILTRALPAQNRSAMLRAGSAGGRLGRETNEQSSTNGPCLR